MTDYPKKSKDERGPRGQGCVRERPANQKGAIKTWELRYALSKGPDGKRRTVVTSFRGTSKEAKAAIREHLHSVDKGLHVDPSKVTVAEYIEKWLTDKKSDVTPKTLERYAELLRRHAAGGIGKINLQKLKREDLKSLYTHLLAEGRDDGKGLSPQTVRHVHRVLSAVLKEATASRLMHENPAAALRSPSVTAPEIEIITAADLDAIMAKLADRPIFPLVATALGTGMRRGELLALRWGDVDLTTGEITVSQALEQTKAGIRVKGPKTKHGYRTIALPAFAISELRRLWKAQQEQRLAFGLGKAPAASPVFATATGEFRRPDSLTKEWATTAKSIGIKVTFHALRHTHASQLIASGLDVVTISRRLGHGNPSITLNVYAKLFKNNEAAVVEVLDKAFSFARTENIPGLVR
jgi:integrase